MKRERERGRGHWAYHIFYLYYIIESNPRDFRRRRRSIKHIYIYIYLSLSPLLFLSLIRILILASPAPFIVCNVHYSHVQNLFQSGFTCYKSKHTAPQFFKPSWHLMLVQKCFFFFLIYSPFLCHHVPPTFTLPIFHIYVLQSCLSIVATSQSLFSILHFNNLLPYRLCKITPHRLDILELVQTDTCINTQYIPLF